AGAATLSLQRELALLPHAHRVAGASSQIKAGSNLRGSAHHVHLNSSIGRARDVVASVTRLNWTVKSAAADASGASKITIASGFPRRPRNSWTMTLFGDRESVV